MYVCMSSMRWDYLYLFICIVTVMFQFLFHFAILWYIIEWIRIHANLIYFWNNCKWISCSLFFFIVIAHSNMCREKDAILKINENTNSNSFNVFTLNSGQFVSFEIFHVIQNEIQLLWLMNRYWFMKKWCKNAMNKFTKIYENFKIFKIIGQSVLKIIFFWKKKIIIIITKNR